MIFSAKEMRRNAENNAKVAKKRTIEKVFEQIKAKANMGYSEASCRGIEEEFVDEINEMLVQSGFEVIRGGLENESSTYMYLIVKW